MILYVWFTKSVSVHVFLLQVNTISHSWETVQSLLEGVIVRAAADCLGTQGMLVSFAFSVTEC